MRRAATAMQIISTNFVELPFDGIWKDLIGTPQLSGCWIIWGESGNGKTAFCLQLAKYLSKFVRVAYDPIEEGISLSFKKALEREKMTECQGRFLVLDKEPIEELEERIKKHKSPSVYFIDSVQYSELNKISAKKLVDRYPHKLFIFTSHASGKLPEGRTAAAIRYHAHVKIRVVGFRAYVVVTRFGEQSGKYYTIYPDGASQYWKFQETLI